MTYQLLITVDVEDWFQVENFKQWIPFSSWPSRESRVEKNTHQLLDLFDAIKLRQKAEDRRQKTEKRLEKNNNTNLSHEIHASDSKAHFIGTVNGEQTELDSKPKNQQLNDKKPVSGIQNTGYENHGQRTTVNGEQKKLHATFFILGWIAQHLPHLVSAIHDRGHEVASHGSNHRLCSEYSFEELRNDLCDSKKHLEDIIGAPVYGYRAPAFSIDDDSLKIIEDCGYLYDSSFNSFGMNERYGWLTLSENEKKGITYQVSETFYELPVSNMTFLKHIIPWGGGGYFRIMPLRLFRWGVELILKKEKSYIFYIHPWEIDPNQPRVNEASGISKFRHYVNLGRTQSRLSNLLASFSHCRFSTCHQYLQHLMI